jgi:hypothetical protein
MCRRAGSGRVSNCPGQLRSDTLKISIVAYADEDYFMYSYRMMKWENPHDGGGLLGNAPMIPAPGLI